LERIGKKLGSKITLRVGFLEGATYPTGPSHATRLAYSERRKAGKRGAIQGQRGGQPVAMVAAVNNYGAPSRGIPPRPFFSNMVKEKSPAWPRAIALNLKATQFDAEATMRRMGEAIQGQLKQSIRDFNSVPLSPKTIARKGFDKQLIDSSHMWNSVDFELEA
jgi:hypothetical protein